MKTLLMLAVLACCHTVSARTWYDDTPGPRRGVYTSPYRYHLYGSERVRRDYRALQDNRAYRTHTQQRIGYNNLFGSAAQTPNDRRLSIEWKIYGQR